MQKMIFGAVASGLILAFSVQSFAQEKSAVKERKESTKIAELSAQKEALFKEKWELSDKEFEKFKDVLRGPFGYYTPNIEKNPILALGYTAETAEERQKYARKHVQIEFAKNIKIFAWQFSVSQAWNNLYPNTKRLADSENDWKTAANMSGSVEQGKQTGGQIELFLSVDCPGCVSEFKKQYKRAKRTGRTLALHFTNKPTKEELTDWAMARVKDAGLDPSEIEQQKITINFIEEDVNSIPFVRD